MNDAALLERWVQRRDADAFNEIVTRFADQVYGTCRNILRNDADAEEVAQECFLLLVRSGDDVRASLGGWLHRVATTKSLDRIRSESRRRKYEQVLSEETPRHAEATWDDIQEHVDAAIDTLPEDLREAVVAHFIGRKSHAEIAGELRLTRRAVSYRIQRGVEALRSELVRRGVTASIAGLGALLLAQALPAAPLSLKASLGKLALAAGLPASTGAGVAIAANAAGSLIIMKAKVLVAVAVACAVIGFYVAIRPITPEQTAANPAQQAVDAQLDGQRDAADNADFTAESTEVIAANAPLYAESQEAVEKHRGAIMGVVLLPSGQPASGAAVRYLWRPNTSAPAVDGLTEHPSQTVTTDAQGRFAFSKVPRGRIAVTAHHPDGVVTESVAMENRSLTRDLSLVLQGGESINGVVVSRDGTAIAGASVLPLVCNGEAISDVERDGRSVVSDTEGRFEAPHLAPGEWTFRTSADAFGTEQSGPFSTGDTNARIVLAKGTAITCRVVEAVSQRPLSGVEVVLKYDDERSAFASAVSTEDGTVIFESLGKGNFTLDVTNDRYTLDGPPIPISTDPARTIEPVIVGLVDGGQIRGRVLDVATGNGIPNVVIRATSGAPGRIFYAVPTAEDGRYVLTGLSAGDLKLGTRNLPPNYSRELPDAPPTVAIAPGQKVEGVDFPLMAGATLGGIVLDTSGAPVAGVQVYVLSDRNRIVLGDLFSQEDGRFAVGDFEAGESVVLAAQSRTASSGRLGPYIAGEPGSDEIEVVLARQCDGAISGRVTDSQGRPFPCRLQARAEEPELQHPVKILSGDVDGLGNFLLTGACAGTYTITIVPDKSARQDSAPIRVEAGQIVSGINLAYDIGQLYEIAGITMDTNGDPVSGVLITAHGQESRAQVPSVKSDENGAFLIKDLPAGRYGFTVSAPGYDSMQSIGSAEAGDMNAEVYLIPLSTISGRVTDSQGRPVTNFVISVAAAQNPDYVRTNQRVSDKDGLFSINSDGPFDLVVRIESEGYAATEVEVDALRNGEGLQDVEVVMVDTP